MRQALNLALKAEEQVSPNPMVGTVIVKSGKVIAGGYHKKAGLPHAEIVALRKAGSKARGADLYVNLEPCCHQGRTPPCTEAIIAAGIKKVVMGIRDPNRFVNGKGIHCLRKNGIEVVTGILKKDCERLNESFLKYIRTGRPWIILKSALSLDGKIATRAGDSKWITGSKAREYVHRLRNRVDAVLVGAGTVRADDPLLTVRLKKGGTQNPARVILAGNYGVPVSARVFRNAHRERVIYATIATLSSARKNKLQKMGVDIIKKKNYLIATRSKKLKSVNIITEPYPGFPTDLQAQIMVLMTKAEGVSTIKENIFENRFMHVSELRRMGAQIEIKGNKAKIFGKSKLNGAELMATDLRASVCLVLAGLFASGKTFLPACSL